MEGTAVSLDSSRSGRGKLSPIISLLPQYANWTDATVCTVTLYTVSQKKGTPTLSIVT